MRPHRPWWPAFFFLGLTLPWASHPVGAQESASPRDSDSGSSVVYLVRHAEKADDDPLDPSLSPAGTRRALDLARLLTDAPLDRIFSTDYRRTRDTAAPVAEAHGLAVESYEPGSQGLESLRDLLRATPGHHLIVGHSNTTPALVELLGGDPVSPVDETEYDRLYVVVVSPDGDVASTLLRFGAD